MRVAAPVSVPRYPLIMSYDLDAVAMGSVGTASFATLRDDARRIRELGFDTLLFRRAFAHADAARDIAVECGLTPAMNDIRADRWLAGFDAVAGRNRSAGDIANELAAGAVDGLLVLEPRRSPAREERCHALAAELRDRGIAFVEIGTPGTTTGSPAAVLVRWANSSRPPLESWLAQFHQGLSLGQTGGLVFREYRRPGDDVSLLDPPDSIDARARRAALGELVARAAAWGPRVAGLQAMPVTCRQAPPDVAVTALGAQRCRYVLVRNRAADRFARGDVAISATFEGVTMRRAVEVAASASAAPGQVIENVNDELRLTVDLRPGEARLFELLPMAAGE